MLTFLTWIQRVNLEKIKVPIKQCKTKQLEIRAQRKKHQISKQILCIITMVNEKHTWCNQIFDWFFLLNEILRQHSFGLYFFVFDTSIVNCFRLCLCKHCLHFAHFGSLSLSFFTICSLQANYSHRKCDETLVWFIEDDWMWRFWKFDHSKDWEVSILLKLYEPCWCIAMNWMKKTIPWPKKEEKINTQISNEANRMSEWEENDKRMTYKARLASARIQ